MKRRDFLSLSVGLAGALWSRSAPAQGPANRAAIVIGVNKAGDLPPLRAAASGAQAVAQWLKEEGFEVKPFIDQPAPQTHTRIKAGDLFDEIEALVKRGTLQQLVIYFAGHGFLVGSKEFWMLSDAPGNPNEAINFTGSADRARGAAIPSVVFISDACRSTADSLRINDLHGYVLFPERDGVNEDVAVDRFFATAPGSAAWEQKVADSAAAYEGIFTTSLLEAFKAPSSRIVRPVNGINVVPNRQLKFHLATDVPRRAMARSGRAQQPLAYVESSETTYLGRALAPPGTAVESRDVVATLDEVARRAIASLGSTSIIVDASANSSSATDEEIDNLAIESGYDVALKRVFEGSRVRPDDEMLAAVTARGRAGIMVVGASLESVVVHPRFASRVTGDGERAQAIVDLREARNAGSALLRFKDGSGTVVAALGGYIATVVVDGGAVVNVSYARGGVSREFDVFRAGIATSARYGLFRFDGPREARDEQADKFIRQSRVEGRIDPTLAIYAAYAEAEAGLRSNLDMLRREMRARLGVDLLDIARLAGGLSSNEVRWGNNIVPLCPMMTQGWTVQRRFVRLEQDVVDARKYLRSAPWTTFKPPGVHMLARVIESGKYR